jgi:hypothetical protein
VAEDSRIRKGLPMIATATSDTGEAEPTGTISRTSWTMAHEAVKSLAIFGGRHGVLITWHDHGTYVVTVSPEVPYVMTYEREDEGMPKEDPVLPRTTVC